MNKYFMYIIVFVLSFLVQFALAPAIAIGGCSPLILLVPVVLVSIHSGYAWGSLTGFVYGLIYDLTYGSVIGCMCLTLTLLGLIVGAVCTNINARSLSISAILSFLAALFTELVYGIAVVLTNADVSALLSTLFMHSIPSAIYDAILLFLFLFIIHIAMEDDTPNSGSELGGNDMSSSAKFARQASRKNSRFKY